MTDITDEQLESISMDVDDFLNKLKHTYGLNTLTATAIILARTTKANDKVGYGREYRLLLNDIVEKF